ncbi:MAG TPA: hypothetical protein PK072_05050, partial [Quisquiliibacterium sp.]|nr:hypothetical protein [Quisquiliibacterium sp.]
ARRPSDFPYRSELLANLSKYRERAGKAQKTFVELVQSGQKDEALNKFLFSVRSTHTKYFEALEQLNSRQHALMEAAGARSAETASNTTVWVRSNTPRAYSR